MSAIVVPDSVSLRAGRLSDLEEMNRLDAICFHPPFRFTSAVMSRFAQEPGAFTLVAESSDGRLAGFILIQVNHESNFCHAYVVTLDVAPQFRRRGLARHLLQAAEIEATDQGASEIALHVWTANLPAVCFYESAQYERKAFHRHLYAPGYDAYDYAKQLKGE